MKYGIQSQLPHVLSFRVLALLLAASVGIPWLMVPHQKELVERLLKDHQYGRVLAVLQHDPNAPANFGEGALRRLSTAQLTRLTELLQLSPHEQLHAIFAAPSPPEYDRFVHVIALAAIQFVDVMSPEEASEIVLPHLERVPEAQQADLLGIIARNALAVNRPKVAALALEKACQTKDADWMLAQKMVQSFEWSGQPGRGAQELQEWLLRRRASLTAAQLQAARVLQFQISLAAGRPEWAFETCVNVLKSDDFHHDDHAWMRRALDAGLQSGRTQELLPFVRLYLATFSESRLPLKQLKSLQRTSQPESSSLHEYHQWLTHMAQWSDWESDFDSAYAAHLRLAVLGDAASLDRCLQLNDTVGRTEQTVQLLEIIDPPSGKEDISLHLAHMLADLGKSEQAAALLKKWVAAHPDEREASFDYACLQEELGDDPGTEKTLQQLLVRHPHDAPATKKLAELYIRHQRERDAMRLFEALPATAHDHHTLESYAMIAESLDDQTARFKALALRLSVEKHPKLETYLEVASAGTYLSDPQPALDVLIQGLAQFPHSPALRVALANSYITASRPDDALATLMTDDCRRSFPAVQSMIGMATWISDSNQLLDYLGDDVEKRFPLSVRQRLDLAVLSSQLGRKAASQRLWASVPEAPANYPALASARIRLGDYPEALRLQTAGLQSHAATAAEWHVLGDIYEHLQRPEDAQKAYRHSLSILTSDLEGTAAN